MKRGILRGAGIVLLALWFFTSRADAYLVTIYIEAEVDSVGDSGNYLEGKINVGDTITGYYTYESTTVDIEPSIYIGRYEHYSSPYGINLTAGGFVFKTDPDNVNFIVSVVNAGGTYTSDDFVAVSNNNVNLPQGTVVEKISWNLSDSTGTALSSDALPTTPPVLSDWQFNVLNISGGEKGYSFGIWGHVTSAVPEPTTILLLGLGIIFLRKNK
jgi:hypothetical protein